MPCLLILIAAMLAIALVAALFSFALGATRMETFWISIAAPVIAVVGSEVYARMINRLGRRVRVLDLASSIRGAAAWGLDGSRMRIEKPGSALFIDFEKVALPSGPESLRMAIYKESCSPREFGGALDALRAIGIDSKVGADVRGRERIVVECGLDVLKAARAARAVLTEAWGVDIEEHLRVWHKGPFPYRPEKLDSVS